jgi:hypothetical protein
MANWARAGPSCRLLAGLGTDASAIRVSAVLKLRRWCRRVRVRVTSLQIQHPKCVAGRTCHIDVTLAPHSRPLLTDGLCNAAEPCVRLCVRGGMCVQNASISFIRQVRYLQLRPQRTGMAEACIAAHVNQMPTDCCIPSGFVLLQPFMAHTFKDSHVKQRLKW